jgi:hypothetical protein
MRAHQIYLQLANLIANDVYIAQLADAGRNRVRNFIVRNQRVDNGTRAVDRLARIRIEKNGLTDIESCDLAHVFE